MQYWAAPPSRTIEFARGAAAFLNGVVTALMSEGLVFEVIVNSDSRRVRHGDLATFLRYLGPSGYLVLSPNLGEARAYNMLARLARGTVLMFVQDDWKVVTERTEWLRRTLAVLADRHHDGGPAAPAGAELGIGMVGTDVGVEEISCHGRGATLAENSALPVTDAARAAASSSCDHDVGATTGDVNGSLVGLIATPCATMGPLFIPRGLFFDVGGFNETLSARGSPASLLDCDLSARVWDSRHAVVVAKMPYKAIQARTPSAAWTSSKMSQADEQRCLQLHRQYAYLFGSFDALLQRSKAVSRRLSLCQTASRSKGAPWLVSDASATRTPPPRRAALLPPTEDASRPVNFSFAVMYWGGGSDAQAKLNEVVLPMLTRLPWASHVAELSCEVLVNSDSRHIRDGDAAMLLGALGDTDTLLLSPNTHEIRAYNRLALIAKGTYIAFLQDDTLPPSPEVEISWLIHSAHLFHKYAQVGSIGMRMGLFFVSRYDEAAVGVQTLDDLPQKMPVCREKAAPYPALDGQPTEDPSARINAIDDIRVEAMRCADVGPLLARRAAFLQVGGYNETATTLGEPASVRVDCDMQARLWLDGFASLYIGLDGNMAWGHTEERRAWKHPKMIAGHHQRMHAYYEQFETPGSAARLHIERSARRMNRNFECPRQELQAKPRTKFDCFIVDAPGTCTM